MTDCGPEVWQNIPFCRLLASFDYKPSIWSAADRHTNICKR